MAKQVKQGSTTSTEGFSSSNTSTQGGSHSVTDSHTEGSSTTETFGKTWASGKVDEKTQANFDRYNQDYVESDKVTSAYDALQQTLSNKPTFESKYSASLDELYNQIMNREKFNYDFNKDAMYQMYKDAYSQGGKQAMQDTMGQASAMTGGYGSSYAQSVGQQTYQNYLDSLNTKVLPTLRDQAMQQYQMEGQELNNKYNITNQAYNNEYGMYRDSVADWQSDRGFNYDMYNSERQFDYGQFTDNRNYWMQEYWNEKNAEHSSYSRSDTNYQEDTHSETNSEYWENSSTTGHTTQNQVSSIDYGGTSTSSAPKQTGPSAADLYRDGIKEIESRRTGSWQDRANTAEEMAARGVQNTDERNQYYRNPDTGLAAWSPLNDEKTVADILSKFKNVTKQETFETKLLDIANNLNLEEDDISYLKKLLGL